MSILSDPATLDTPTLERAITMLETWRNCAALILEQRRADEADCDLVEFQGMEFA